MADNDLALGRLVDAVSHSKFWKSTAIFVEEDDAQNGVDHVDGHRAPALVISPWSKTGVNANYYTELNMTKTIEQILGLPPMNQMDREAPPMWSAFGTKANLGPYNVVPNQIPPTEGLPPGPGARSGSAVVAVPTAERAVYHQWTFWMKLQESSGRTASPDLLDPRLSNRYTWYMAHNWKVPYPGDKAILSPKQIGVPNYIWQEMSR